LSLADGPGGELLRVVGCGAAVVAHDELDLHAGWELTGVFLHVELDALVDLVAERGERAGRSGQKADLDCLRNRATRQQREPAAEHCRPSCQCSHHFLPLKGRSSTLIPRVHGFRHSALIPAALITFPHLSISRFRNAPNSSGVVGTASAPCAASALFASARLRL